MQAYIYISLRYLYHFVYASLSLLTLPLHARLNVCLSQLSPLPLDPCGELFCGAGRMCVVNDDGEGECRCVNTCDDEADPRRRVSNFAYDIEEVQSYIFHAQ